MKKLLSLLICAMIICLSLVLFSCDKECESHDFGEWIITVAPTCESAGEQKRTCKNCTETETKALEITLEHDYEVSGWIWSDDLSFAFLSLKCSTNSAHEKNISATLEEVAGDAPTCTANGKKYIRASASFEGTTYTESKEIEISALGHEYKNDGKCIRCESECPHKELDTKYLNLADYGYCPSFIGYTECKECKMQTLDTECLSYLCTLDKNGTCTTCGIKSNQTQVTSKSNCVEELSLSVKIFDDKNTYLDGSVVEQSPSHSDAISYYLDLREYSSCHNYFYVGACEDCGEILYVQEYEIFCNDGVMPEAESVTKLDGLTHNITTIDCDDCSLKIVIDKYTRLDGCNKTDVVELVIYDQNDTPITSFIDEEYAGGECDWDIKYLFTDEENKSCYDGVIMVGECKECHQKASYKSDYHNSFTEKYVDLTGCDDACPGAWILNRVCDACGLVIDMDYEYSCAMTPSAEVVNGVTVYTYACSSCPIKYSYSMATDENCHTVMTRDIFYGTTSLTSVIYEYTEHNLEESYNLLGATCKDGVEIVSECTACDYSESEIINECRGLIEEEYILNSYDSTISNELVLNVKYCPCGTCISSNIYEISLSDFTKTEEDGFEKYESQNGEVVFILKGTTKTDDCTAMKYIDITAKIAGVVLFEDYKYIEEASTSHDYENININIIDGNCKNGGYMAKACKNCDHYDVFPFNSHITDLIYSLDLDQSKGDNICNSHSLDIMACVCNRQIDLYGDYESLTLVEAGGVKEYSCSTCDYKLRIGEGKENKDGCVVLYYLTIEICNGNTPFYEKIFSYEEIEHTFTPTVEPGYAGNPTITARCTECNKSAISTIFNVRTQMASDGSYCYDYIFTAPKTATYSFYSVTGYDTEARLYMLVDNEYKLVASNDDDGINNNFLITYDLIEGETYALRAGDYDFDENIDISFVVAEGAVNICSDCYTSRHKIDFNSTGCLGRQILIDICVECLGISNFALIDDHSLVYNVIDSGECYHLSGNCSQCSYNTFAQIHNYTLSNSNNTFEFTPSVSGFYSFYSIGDHDTVLYIYEEDSLILVNDNSGVDNNFYLNCYLVEGVTYTLEFDCWDYIDSVEFDFVIQNYKPCEDFEHNSTPTVNDNVTYCPDCGSIISISKENN